MSNVSFSREVSQSELNYLRSQGLTNKEIAKRTGASIATISKYLPTDRKNPMKLTDNTRLEIGQLYEDGYSVKYISTYIGCSLPVVYATLKRLGVELRKKKTKKEEAKPVQAPSEVKAEADIPAVGNLARKEFGAYTGWLGRYLVDLESHRVILPQVAQEMGKETLGNYIRDLMAVYKEM